MWSSCRSGRRAGRNRRPRRMPTTHLLDPDRGRASKTKMWTLCGEQAMTRLVFGKLDAPQANCKACILAEALEDWLKLAIPCSASEFTRIKLKARAALDRARGEQTPDAPK